MLEALLAGLDLDISQIKRGTVYPAFPIQRLKHLRVAVD